MLEAREVRRKYNQKTFREIALEKIDKCIQFAASRGETSIKYRWPYQYLYDSYFIYDLRDLGYTVTDGNVVGGLDKDTLYISW